MRCALADCDFYLQFNAIGNVAQAGSVIFTQRSRLQTVAEGNIPHRAGDDSLTYYSSLACGEFSSHQ
jgi:hypothetical protein